MSHVSDETHNSRQHRFIVVMRWLAFIPAAYLAALVVPLVVGVANFLVAKILFGSKPGWSFYFMVWTGYFAGGAAFVFLGTYIAPARKVVVALSLAGVTVISAGYSLGIRAADYAVYGIESVALTRIVAALAGSILASVAIASGKVRCGN